jgi:hypothetical protein
MRANSYHTVAWLENGNMNDDTQDKQKELGNKMGKAEKEIKINVKQNERTGLENYFNVARINVGHKR